MMCSTFWKNSKIMKLNLWFGAWWWWRWCGLWSSWIGEWFIYCRASYNLHNWKVTIGVLVMVVNKESESTSSRNAESPKERSKVIHLLNYCARYNVNKYLHNKNKMNFYFKIGLQIEFLEQTSVYYPAGIRASFYYSFSCVTLPGFTHKLNQLSLHLIRQHNQTLSNSHPYSALATF